MTAHRVVSLIASATKIVTALGYGAHLVGRSHECDYPPSVEALPVCSSTKVDPKASSRAFDDRVRQIVADGLSVYSVNPVQLDRLAPTVIVTQTQCEVCAVSLRDVKQAVCDLVSSQPRIVSLEPMSLADVWNDIRSVAEALGDTAKRRAAGGISPRAPRPRAPAHSRTTVAVDRLHRVDRAADGGGQLGA